MANQQEIPIRSVADLAARYRSGSLRPSDVAAEVLRRCDASTHDHVWITRLPAEQLMARAAELERLGPSPTLTLYGIPFAVKDNIDVEGLPTTAACPEFAYNPSADATVVRKLLAAGAMVVGKTNLDQFATGLNGTRSPYGAPACVFNAEYISGGSSSGSAVAVAGGLVSFSLGTDTAGSGRVPAAFNNLIGLKPTRGLLSTSGVVPACRSIDCLTIFANSIDDAGVIFDAAKGFDATDPFSRASPAVSSLLTNSFRFGVPRDDQLKIFGDDAARALYLASLDRLRAIGGQQVTIDYAPFESAARLLYGGAFVAERYAAVGAFLETHPAAGHPIVRKIIESGKDFTAAEAFAAQYELADLRRRSEATWNNVDVLALPTAGTIYKIAQMLADPITLNSNLGYYTNFVNLFDLSALALPAGFRGDGLPFGITLIAPAWCDDSLITLARRYDGPATAETLNSPEIKMNEVQLAVVGAHLSGMPLNPQLTSRNARLVRACRTAPRYRLYALANTTPPKPGLVHVGTADGGAAIEVEVWAMTTEAFGSLVAEVPAPLAIGTAELEDGTSVKGFICEPRAIAGATDITHLGGWRAYVAQRKG